MVLSNTYGQALAGLRYLKKKKKGHEVGRGMCGREWELSWRDEIDLTECMYNSPGVNSK